MSRHTTTRYCADPQALRMMQRDGLGWGHDMDCGSFYDVTQSAKPTGLARVFNTFKWRT